MALYTRIWATSRFNPQPVAHLQTSSLTLQAASEIINTTYTLTHSEIKLAYSLWERQLRSNKATQVQLHYQARD